MRVNDVNLTACYHIASEDTDKIFLHKNTPGSPTQLGLMLEKACHGSNGPHSILRECAVEVRSTGE